MTTKLDALLSSLNSNTTITETFNRANLAIDTFIWGKIQITDWDEFISCMARFHYHVQDYVLRLRQKMPLSEVYEWPRCARVLRNIYGPNGEKAGFELARTGNEGGLNAVLRAIAMHMAEQYSKTEISARVIAYWNSLSVAEQLAAPSEYITKYSKYLPSEMTESSAARIRANFPKLLEHHPHMIHDLNRAVR